jgi:DNA ligase (NAD+)
MNEEALVTLIRKANKAYYVLQKPIMSDAEYDALCTILQNQFPLNTVASEGHTNTPVFNRKVQLPYEMWSLDKIKPDTATLSKWLLIHGPVPMNSATYVVSCKVDGISALYHNGQLFTRGNGIEGQDISACVPYLSHKLPHGFCSVRGEIIVRKDVFEKKYAKLFANPRNFVGGILNQKVPPPDIVQDLSFVAYEVLEPRNLLPASQLTFLQEHHPSVEVIQYQTLPEISLHQLADLFQEWRRSYPYEIDGLVCYHNAKLHARIPGQNPSHAFAFKMALAEQSANTTVVAVHWAASKDGYLKPRVQFEPITIGGVLIEYATGFNAKFIQENGLGPGALIQVVRSGDVIPHIAQVLQSTAAQLPSDLPCVWNANNVDLVLTEEAKAQDPGVLIKNITGFFTTIGVDGLGPGITQKLVAGGYDSIKKIVRMTTTDFSQLAGFQITLALKIQQGILTRLQEASLPLLMHASNLFGRGYGLKKITKAYTEQSLPALELQTFQTFLQGIGINYEDKKRNEDEQREEKEKEKEKETEKEDNNILLGKTVVISGFRDIRFQELLTQKGAILGTNVTKTTFALVCNNTQTRTGKTADALKYNIPILTLADFHCQFI